MAPDKRQLLFKPLVQLGGLEPPTSCSTDRRSNQLSYNCILASRALDALKRAGAKGGWTGRKLGATGVFGKAAEGRKTSSNHVRCDEIGLDGSDEGVSPGCGETPRGERALTRRLTMLRIAQRRPLPHAGEAKKKPGPFGPGFYCLA